MHEPISWRRARKRLLTCVYDAENKWHRASCRCRVPSRAELFNFVVATDTHTWLVLDPGGDELMPDDVREGLFGRVTMRHRSTLAVDVMSGEIRHMAFGTEDKGLIGVTSRLLLSANGMYVPKTYLPRLHELKSQKRPFAFSLTAEALFAFHTRRWGLEDVVKHLVVCLQFDENAVEVTWDMWREVGSWRDDESSLSLTSLTSPT